MEKGRNRRYRSVREVTSKEHVAMVKDIFSTITGRYDFLNRLLSLRRDVAWRKFTAKKMRFFQTNRLLDIACGTADLLILAAREHQQIDVTGLDLVNAMLYRAQEKIYREGLEKRSLLIQGDALSLPFNDNTFDVTSIAFGIRNIPDRNRALEEMARVTVPGGQVAILEMTLSENRFFRFFYKHYLSRMIPTLAQRFTTNPAAYHYLADSIMNFPSPRQFASYMEDAGMTDVAIHPLTLGITYLFIAKKPANNETR